MKWFCENGDLKIAFSVNLRLIRLIFTPYQYPFLYHTNISFMGHLAHKDYM